MAPSNFPLFQLWDQLCAPSKDMFIFRMKEFLSLAFIIISPSLSLSFFLFFSLRLQTGRSLEIHELVYVLFLLLRLFRSRLTSFAKNLFLYFPYPFFFIFLLIFSDFVELRAFYGFLTKHIPSTLFLQFTIIV